MRYYSDEFWNAAALLRKNIKTNLPMRIRTVPSAVLTKAHDVPCYGDCERKKDHHLIRIARGMTTGVAIDTLIHEVGHAMDFDANPNQPRDYHRKSWGENFSKAYRVIFPQQ